MTERALIVCPGRGSYGADDLHSLAKWQDLPGAAAKRDGILAVFDAYRREVGSETISDLDGAAKYQASRHAPGENAGPLIFACSAIDMALLPEKLYRPVAVCGNSMGWYSSLAVGGALGLRDAVRVIDTMSKTQRQKIVGGQVIMPIVDDEWRIDPAARAEVMDVIARVRAEGHVAAISIELGGFIVLGGDEAAVARFKELLPPKKMGKRDYPFQLVAHAAFHTSLMTEHSRIGMEELPDLDWRRPQIPMIDGHGRIWRPFATDLHLMRRYTFIQQALETYDFSLSLRVGLREFAPDVIILLGPGDTLGGAIGQTLVQEGWQGIRSKSEFQRRQESDRPILISLGRRADFARFVRDRIE